MVNNIYPALTALFALYLLVTATFLLLDNRSPQSTVAWMLLFFTFPVVGVIVYLLFGRDTKAFSRENRLVRQEIGGDLSHVLAPVLSQQDDEIDKLARASDVSERKLLRLMRQNSLSTLTVHNCLEILQDAREKYPRLVDDFKAARQSIHLQYYEWAADPLTEKIKSILIEKVNEGVEVRLLYDPIGSFTEITWRYIREMRAGGIEMYPFSPLYRLHTIGYRNHRKIAVIDGQIGYSGGLNIGQKHIDGGYGFKAWRDTHVRVVGEAAAILQAIFVVDWYNATRINLSLPAYFPPLPAEAAQAYLPVQVTLSGPDSHWQAIRQLYFFMILAAEQHVYLQSPFFIIDDSIAEALRAAALSGVQIKIMLAPWGAGNRTPYWAANTYIKDMAEAGIRVFFYQKGYFHPKTLSIDGKICSIGSANMDIRSFSINYEANTVIYDPGIAQQLEADFEKDLEHCTEFDLAEYEDQNIALKLRDSAARLFSPLL